MLPHGSSCRRQGLRTVSFLAAAWLSSGESKYATIATELAESDSCSFMQKDAGSKLYASAQRPTHPAAATQKNAVDAELEATSRCLNFLHIPRTGGTSIASLNMHQSKPVFGSMMLETYKKIAAHMPAGDFKSLYASSLGGMFDKSRRTLTQYITSFMPIHYSDFNFVIQPDGGSCEDHHTPPGHSQDVGRFLHEGSCHVFCAVREPLQRFISAYEAWGIGPCDAAGFESKVRSLLSELRTQQSKNVCMFTPQVQYVFGAASKEQATTQYCHHVLHTERLNSEFDALLKDHGQNLTLPTQRLMGRSTHMGCKVDGGEVTQAARDLIFEHFRADYEAFGYPRP